MFNRTSVLFDYRSGRWLIGCYLVTKRKAPHTHTHTRVDFRSFTEIRWVVRFIIFVPPYTVLQITVDSLILWFRLDFVSLLLGVNRRLILTGEVRTKSDKLQLSTCCHAGLCFSYLETCLSSDIQVSVTTAKWENGNFSSWWTCCQLWNETHD